MRIVPDSTITLYQNVDIDNGEQLVFSSRANQNAYFDAHRHPQGIYTPCTVVRKTGLLKVEKSLAIVSACNYLSFVNPIGTMGENKTIYARIIDYEYENNECTTISYAIDYWQTWMFDVDFHDSFIEREHLSQADWTLAQSNPYDPSIMEFRTSEDLPFGKDTEKPYYTYGTTAADDGVYCGDAVCNEIGISNRFGVLICFSDVNFKYLDEDIEAGTTTPSAEFISILNSIKSGGVNDEPVNFYKLSTAVFGYLNQKNPGVVNSSIFRGDGWDVNIGGNTYNLYPGTSNLKPPISYIFIDGGASVSGEFETATEKVSSLLDWFTRYALLDSVLGIYPIPAGLALMSGSVYGQPIGASLPTAVGQNVVNKKLDLYPYSYYRLIAPNGDVKELRIEDFKTAQDAAGPCQIALSLDMVEKPNLIVAPVGYKAAGASPHNQVGNVNVREGLLFTQFPTLPYAIDAFTAQLAAVANSMIGNNTVANINEFKYQGIKLADKAVSDGVETVAGIANAASSAAQGNIGGAVGSIIGATKSGKDLYNTTVYEGTMYDNEAKMRNDVYKARLNDDNNAIYDNYRFTKPAYAGDIYNQINGDGVTNFNYNAFVDILFMRVTMHPTIMAMYDNYFTHYGYSSGRCGIPRVINYMKGQSSDASVPHWLNVNGHATTYIKTRDCKVVHSMLPVAQYIKTMFDGGVRMIKGDPS